MGLNWLAPIQKELLEEDNGNILLITKNRHNIKELIRSLKYTAQQEKTYNLKVILLGTGNTYTKKQLFLQNLNEVEEDNINIGFSKHLGLESETIKGYLEESSIQYGVILLDNVLPELYAASIEVSTEDFFYNTLQELKKYLVKNGRLIINDNILKSEVLTQYTFKQDVSLELSLFLKNSRYSKIGRPNIRRTKQGIKVNGRRDLHYIYSTDLRTIQEFVVYLEDKDRSYEKVYGVYNELSVYKHKSLKKVYHREYGEFKGITPALQTTVLVKK